NQTPLGAAGCPRAQGPPALSPAGLSARRTPGATDNTSPRSPRSGGLRPPCSGPARPERRPAAASRQSLQACIASLPLQSSWMSKTYLKSDHFNGGGSLAVRSPLSEVSSCCGHLLQSSSASASPLAFGWSLDTEMRRRIRVRDSIDGNEQEQNSDDDDHAHRYNPALF